MPTFLPTFAPYRLQALRIALETPEVVARMSQEEYHTAQVFKHDFQKSGIHLQESTRELFVNYSDSLLQSGRQFTMQLSGPKNTKTILPDASKLVPGLGQSFVRRVAARDGAARIAVNSWEGSMILRKAEDEDARRAVWTDNVKGSEYQEIVLNGMLDTRRKMAGVVGRNSWGEVELENKMAQSPGASRLEKAHSEWASC
jgi:intermediate peptidase